MTTFVGDATASVPGITGNSIYSNVLAIKAIATQYYGVYGQASAGTGIAGIFGYNIGTSGTAIGVAGETDSSSGYGVYAEGPSTALYAVGAIWCENAITCESLLQSTSSIYSPIIQCDILDDLTPSSGPLIPT